VDAWFTMACARVPQERFPSARDMAVALARALGDASLSAPLSGAVFTPPPPTALGAYSPSHVSPDAPTLQAPAPEAAKSAPTLVLPPEDPPKVPSLAPPPLRTPTRAPREPEPADEAWKAQLTRHVPVDRVSVTPAAERSRRTPAPEPPEEPEERPRSLWGLVVLGLVVLLSVGFGLALRGKDALRVLFPGLAAPAAPGPR
jgi:hypothetical protein